MSDQVTVSPETLDGFAGLMDRERYHFASLTRYARQTSGNTRGLHGVLTPLAAVLHRLAGAHADVLTQCAVGLTDDADKLRLAAGDFTRVDHHAAMDINDLYPSPPSWFHTSDLGSPHGLHEVFRVELDQPPDPHTDIEDRAYQVGGAVGAVDWVASHIFGHSLFDLVLEPITGEYGRLGYLAAAYQTQGQAVYHVAWNLRSGTMRVASHWDGEAAREFEYRMFCWHMGLGGLADMDTVIGGALGRLYEYVGRAVSWILDKVEDLVDRVLKKIAERMGPGGWIKAIAKAKQTVDLIHEAVRIVGDIEDDIKQLRANLDTFVVRTKGWIDMLNDFTSHPAKKVRDLLNQGYTSGVVSFEAPHSHLPAWPARWAAPRVALLPI